jgi:hypothetical protein
MAETQFVIFSSLSSSAALTNQVLFPVVTWKAVSVEVKEGGREEGREGLARE